MTDQHGPIGPDGKTPRQRLAERGFDLDDKGQTVEVGHSGGMSRMEPDPWHWLDGRKSALELWCHRPRKGVPGLVAHVWRGPDDALWYRSAPEDVPGGYRLMGPVEAYRHGPYVMVSCPHHRMALVPFAWLQDVAFSTRRRAQVLCLDERPVYTQTT